MDGIRAAPRAKRELPLAGFLPSNRLAQFICLLVFACLIRCPAWGEWNFSVDDQFYAFVGERIRQGDLLYVDIWDRKGPLLYLIFTAISYISPTMLAYQLVATVFAALGAYGVNRIARMVAPPAAAMLSALAYLALLSRFEGDNLEAGVFFNPLVIAAAWALITRFALLRTGRIDAILMAGFFSAGLAIAIKQTAAFEGALFGIVAVALMLRSGARLPGIAARAAALAFAGALPMLATGLFYWRIGHFPELWSAMVTSNFARGYSDPFVRALHIVVMAGMLAIPAAFAVLGLMSRRDTGEPARAIVRLIVAWALVALALVFLFPNIYVHYAQSTLPPLTILCALYFAHRRPLWPALAALIPLSLAFSGTFHLADRWRARAASAALIDYARAVTPHKRMLVWGGSTYIYSKVGAKPLSPVPFAPHLFEGLEWTGFDTGAEMRRILAQKPETVVAQDPLVSLPLNEVTTAMVEAYKRTCRKGRRFPLYDHNGRQDYIVLSQCGQT